MQDDAISTCTNLLQLMPIILWGSEKRCPGKKKRGPLCGGMNVCVFLVVWFVVCARAVDGRGTEVDIA